MIPSFLLSLSRSLSTFSQFFGRCGACAHALGSDVLVLPGALRGSSSARFVAPDAGVFEAQFVTLCFGIPGTNHRTHVRFFLSGPLSAVTCGSCAFSSKQFKVASRMPCSLRAQNVSGKLLRSSPLPVPLGCLLAHCSAVCCSSLDVVQYRISVLIVLVALLTMRPAKLHGHA